MNQRAVISDDWLERLNLALQSSPETLVTPNSPAENVFVVGAPRSGTTLLLQMIVAALDIGYVSNLAASFWMRPEAGVLLSRKWLDRPTLRTNSNYGQTEGPEQPHEFGGFWRRVLGYQAMEQAEHPDVDWAQVELELDRIGAAWQRPVVYKVFQLYWHLAEFHRRRPSRWIWVQRDPIANAASLLRLMERRDCGFTSAVPESVAEYETSERWQQATVQVFCLHRWLQGQWDQLDSDSKLIVALSDLQTNPSRVMNEVGGFLDMDPMLLDFQNGQTLKARPPEDADLLNKIQRFWEEIS